VTPQCSAHNVTLHSLAPSFTHPCARASSDANTRTRAPGHDCTRTTVRRRAKLWWTASAASESKRRTKNERVLNSRKRAPRPWRFVSLCPPPPSPSLSCPHRRLFLSSFVNVGHPCCPHQQPPPIYLSQNTSHTGSFTNHGTKVASTLCARCIKSPSVPTTDAACEPRTNPRQPTLIPKSQTPHPTPHNPHPTP
jgi:hypothetical protein